jgi:catechol 2,3-dioxygenase-like lactoylglutathione lyase family enzyme
MPIKGIHAMFFTPNAEEMRAFLRDKIGLPFTDSGDGWLTFGVPAGEIGCHPSEGSFHKISFYCDDIQETVAGLHQRGIEVSQEIVEEDWGFVAQIAFPDDQKVDLFQAKDKNK